MHYLIYIFLLIFAILLFNIIRKTIARNIFEAQYQRALKRRTNVQAARFWGALYYSSFSRNELRAGGIRDSRAAIQHDIDSHHFQVH